MGLADNRKSTRVSKLLKNQEVYEALQAIVEEEEEEEDSFPEPTARLVASAASGKLHVE